MLIFPAVVSNYQTANLTYCKQLEIYQRTAEENFFNRLHITAMPAGPSSPPRALRLSVACVCAAVAASTAAVLRHLLTAPAAFAPAAIAPTASSTASAISKTEGSTSVSAARSPPPPPPPPPPRETIFYTVRSEGNYKVCSVQATKKNILCSTTISSWIRSSTCT